MSGKFYYYVFYGLRIKSEIPLDPLKPEVFGGDTDIFIKKEIFLRPDNDQEDKIYKPATVYGKGFFYWNVEGITQFQISDKHTILIDKVKYISWKDVRAFLLDTVLTVALLLHEKFVFHASCVSTEKGAFLICSGAGNGKSTLAALLVKKGLHFVEDDRCLLQWNDKQECFEIQCHVAVASVWKNIRAWEKNEKVVALGPVRKNIQKFQYDVSALIPPKPVEVKKMYLIEMDNGEHRIEKNDIKGISKVNVVRNYTHFDHLVPGLGKSKSHFKIIAKIASMIPAVKVERSQLTPIPEFVNYMYDEITS